MGRKVNRRRAKEVPVCSIGRERVKEDCGETGGPDKAIRSLRSE